jgi:hypothetical protein
MGSMLALCAGVLPGLSLLLFRLARPRMVDAAFDTSIRSLSGLILLPFDTLMYLILRSSGGDRFWVIRATFVDIAHCEAIWVQRRQAPGYPART